MEYKILESFAQELKISYFCQFFNKLKHSWTLAQEIKIKYNKN